jgi:hypothetical protein
VTDRCLPSLTDPMLLTIQVTPSRSSLSPTANTRSVNQYSVLPLGIMIERVRGKARFFPPHLARWLRLSAVRAEGEAM